MSVYAPRLRERWPPLAGVSLLTFPSTGVPELLQLEEAIVWLVSSADFVFVREVAGRLRRSRGRYLRQWKGGRLVAYALFHPEPAPQARAFRRFWYVATGDFRLPAPPQGAVVPISIAPGRPSVAYRLVPRSSEGAPPTATRTCLVDSELGLP